LFDIYFFVINYEKVYLFIQFFWIIIDLFSDFPDCEIIKLIGDI